jgi:hypothetical protein
MYRRAALLGYVRRYDIQSRGDDARPGESCSGRGAVACPVLKQGGFEGEGLVVDRTGYSGRRGGIPSPRAPQRWSGCSSAWRGAAGAGMGAQD